MNRQRMVSISCFIVALYCLMIIGCSKPILPIIKNESLPAIIKTFKHTTILAGTFRMKNTGVYIDKGDMYTIMATGNMDYCPMKGCGYNNVKPEDGWPIMAKISKNSSNYSALNQKKVIKVVEST